MAVAPQTLAPGPEVLPETAAVHWRPRVDDARLRRLGRLWTLTTVAHVVPFVGAAALLMWLNPLALPVALACVAHAWVIPELYAQRGANVVRPRAAREPARSPSSARWVCSATSSTTTRASCTRGPASCSSPAALAHGSSERPARCCCAAGGRRAYCYCVRVDPRVAAEAELPSGDRVAHLLLALRADEQGFATVANLAFWGARWRLRRRIPKQTRPALKAALAASARRSSAAASIRDSGPMPAAASACKIRGMPDASSDLTRRALVEVAASQASSPKDPIVRRYRLARVPLYTRPAPALD